MRASRALEREMDIMGRHWLDYDPVALAALIIGIGIVESLALVRSPMISPGRRAMVIRSWPRLLSLLHRSKSGSQDFTGSRDSRRLGKYTSKAEQETAAPWDFTPAYVGPGLDAVEKEG